MPISSQFPALTVIPRGGALEALALQPGQVITAKVIGPAPNGGTQVQIGDQTLNLLLPVPVKPGTVLQLEVAISGGQQRLVLQPQPAPVPATPPSVAPLPTPPQIPLPGIVAAIVIAAPAPVVPAAQVAAAAQPAPMPATSSVPTSAVAQTPSPPALPSSAGSPQAPLPAPSAAQSAPIGQQPPVPVPPGILPGSVAVAPRPASTPAAPAQLAPAAPAAAVQNAPARAAATMAAPLATAPAQPPAPPQPPVTPQAVLAQMVQASAQRQGSVAALTSALTSIAGKIALPEPVIRAAQQILAARLSLNGPLDGATLQKAVLGSGIFQEAALAAGRVPAQSEMKSALLALRQTLSNWLGPQSALAPVAMAPPVRGGVPRARMSGEGSPIDPATAPEEAGKILLERTDAALSRIRLHQHASLPDPTGKQGGDWSLDLPVLVGSHQTLLHLQIHRDGKGNAEVESEPGWQMRFALNLPALGEVGAQVSLRGGATGVMLWATEPETAALLDNDLPQLRKALAGTGLHLGSIVVRGGEPAATAAPAGHFLDAQR